MLNCGMTQKDIADLDLSEMDWDEERIDNMEKSIKEYLGKRQIPALVRIALSENVIDGARELISNYGMGNLAPNTILLGETEHRENFVEFSGFIRHAYRFRRNLVIVREGSPPERVKDRPLTICVWWGGRRENAGLMLVLGYMLQMSPEWKNSRLQLKTIVSSEGGCEAAFEHLRNYIEESRLDVEVEVLLKKPEDSIDKIIGRTSEGADFVILGIKPPGEEESVSDYARYYEKLLKSSKGYPPTAFVLSAEMIHFSDIFN
jgi:solute carrier family 12 sodium/potassium/chloride transporter 2